MVHFMQGQNDHTFRLETLKPTSDSVIPILLKKVTIEEISSASAYKDKNHNLDKYKMDEGNLPTEPHKVHHVNQL